MTKLVYIFNGRLPTEKAHGLQIVKMCEAFADLGIQVDLLIPFRSNSLREDIFEYYSVRRNFNVKTLGAIDPMQFKWFPERLAFWVQSFTSGVSIILYLLTRRYPEDTIFYARDYVSLFILSFLKLNPISEIHDYRFLEPRRFFSFIVKRARKIVVNSEGTLKLVKAHYKIYDGKTIVASNGVDLDFFNIPETCEESRKLLNMPLDKKIVGYVGRLETVGREKGVSTLMNAFIKLNNYNNLILYVVGGPDELVSKYKSQYSGVENLILTGQVEYKKIPLYLRAIDMVVIPMLDDQHAKTTSPIKLFEFLAAGKVIIASDLPSLKNYLNDSNALFFKTGNIEDLADKIGRVLSEPGLEEKLSAKAKADSQQHSWLSRADKILGHRGLN